MFNPGSGTGGPRAKAQRLEMLAGILGFFTFMAFVQTIAVEFKGGNAVAEALILAVLVIATWFVIQKRRAIKL